MTSNQVAAQRKVVAVFGATGHTGRFVVTQLARRGMIPLLCGRDEAKLRELAKGVPGSEVRAARLDDPLFLDRAFEGAVAVINCAGPYLDTAPAVIEAAIRQQIHYLDVTAEQASVADTFDRYGAASEAARVVIAPAMGFYGALADLAATVAVGEWPRADEVRIAIALDSWHPTQGTRLTGERNTVPRVVWSEGRLQQLADPAPEQVWNFPNPFGPQDVVEVPLSEIITLSRHLPTPEIHNYLNTAPLKELSDPNTPPPTATDESGRSSQQFLVEVVARRDSEERRVMARGRDIYATTAPIVVEAAARIIDGSAKITGVGAASELFDAASFLRALESEDFVVDWT